MMQMALPGLERLLDVCRRLRLSLLTLPPGQVPPASGTRMGGLPLDPMLAAFYARFGKAVFAAEIGGMGLVQLDDTVNELEAQNREWQRDWPERFPVPVFLFGGEPGLAYSYATLPGLADAEGLQPVVRVDTHEEPYALPVASNVDAFFAVYSRYLEALVAHPDYAQEGSAALTFPRGVPHLLAQDTRLVELMRSGCCEPLLGTDENRAWVARVVAAHG